METKVQKAERDPQGDELLKVTNEPGRPAEPPRTRRPGAGQGAAG